jgi:hypothetical protein
MNFTCHYTQRPGLKLMPKAPFALLFLFSRKNHPTMAPKIPKAEKVNRFSGKNIISEKSKTNPKG